MSLSFLSACLFYCLQSLYCFTYLQTVDNSVVTIIPKRQTTAEDVTRSPENKLFSNGRSSFVSRGNSFGQQQEKSSNGKFRSIRSPNKVVVTDDTYIIIMIIIFVIIISIIFDLFISDSAKDTVINGSFKTFPNSKDEMKDLRIVDVFFFFLVSYFKEMNMSFL